MSVRDLGAAEASPAADRVPALRVFLRTADGEPLDGPLGTLARLFGLDVYGTSLLGRRTRLEMKFAALLLLVVIAFDCAAWFLLFNAVFHARILALSGWSLAAVVAAALLSAVVFLYERWFLTADSSRLGWRLTAPIAFRVLVVVAAALITAQPVELLFFRSAIAERAHQEGIREELTTRLGELREMEEAVAALSAERTALPQTLRQQVEFIDREAAADRVGELTRQRLELQGEKARADQAERYWAGVERDRAAVVARRRRELRQVEADPAAAAALVDGVSALDHARRQLGRAESSHRQAARNRAANAGKARELATELSVVTGLHEEALPVWMAADEQLRARREELEERIAQRTRAVQGQRERLRDWIRQLRRVAPGEGEPIREAEDPADPARGRLGYRFPRYHFFEQLRVLSDLRAGRPPAWEGVAAGQREPLAKEFGLMDPQDCAAPSAPQPCDAMAWDRHLASTRGMLWAYVVVYAIALIIPLLVVALKFLVPPELAAYYSVDQQARAGNPDALRLARRILPDPSSTE